MKKIASALVALAAATITANAQNVQITEIMYTGLFGEFVEITNVDPSVSADLAATSTNGSDNGWKFSDNRAGTNVTAPGTIDATSLSQVGTLLAGQSAIITEVSDTIFVQAWYTEPGKSALPTSRIVENNAINLGRSDTVNIYDEDNFLIDSVVYNDQTPIFGPRSEDISAKPDSTLTAAGLNSSFSTWLLSGTAAGGTPNGNAWKAGVTGAPGPIGSPGVYPN